MARFAARSRRAATGLLAALAGGALVLLATRGDGDTLLGADRDTALLWVRACATGPVLMGALLALVLGRMLRGVRRQDAYTRTALRPLLALPAVSPPADLLALLRAERLDGRTRIIALEAPVALCHGLLRPRLLLSTGVLAGLSSAEMGAVVQHELAHLRRRDPLRLIVARAVAEALPVVPALRQLAVGLPIAQELAADRAALAVVGADALGCALLKVGDTLGATDLPLAVGAFGALDARIDQLLGIPMPPLLPAPRSLLPLAVVLVASPVLCVVLPLPAGLMGCGVLALSLLARAWQRPLRHEPSLPRGGRRFLR